MDSWSRGSVFARTAHMVPACSMSNQPSTLDSTMDSDRSTASHVSVLSFSELLSHTSNVKGPVQPQLSAVPFAPSLTSPRDVESTPDALFFESSCGAGGPRPTRIYSVVPPQKTGYRRLWALVNSVKRGDPVNSRSGADDLSVSIQQSVAAYGGQGVLKYIWVVCMVYFQALGC
jgi:hypothetical protein